MWQISTGLSVRIIAHNFIVDRVDCPRLNLYRIISVWVRFMQRQVLPCASCCRMFRLSRIGLHRKRIVEIRSPWWDLNLKFVTIESFALSIAPPLLIDDDSSYCLHMIYTIYYDLYYLYYLTMIYTFNFSFKRICSIAVT